MSNSISTRERTLIRLALVLLAVVLFYHFVWAGLGQKNQQLKATIQEKSTLLASLRRQMPLLSEQHAAQNIADKPLLSIIERDVRQAKLAQFATETTLKKDGRVQLRFANVPFDQFIAWLVAINKKYAITTQSIAIKRLPKDGFVAVDLELATV